MNYVCIENDRIISILAYEPNVPDTVKVVIITDDEKTLLEKKAHYFCLQELVVKPKPEEFLKELEIEKEKAKARKNLYETDWKVLRHLREKTLNLSTTLTEEEYLALEIQRNSWAEFLGTN